MMVCFKKNNFLYQIACADPEGGGGRGSGPPPPPEKSQNIGFSSNTGPDPLKNRSYCEGGFHDEPRFSFLNFNRLVESLQHFEYE